LDLGDIFLQELTDVGEHRGVARRNAIFRDGFEEAAEGAIEVGVGAELDGRRGVAGPGGRGTDNIWNVLSSGAWRRSAGRRTRMCRWR
jgi:hypothetical protein